jgi:Flp pilus assembly protein TadG
MMRKHRISARRGEDDHGIAGSVAVELGLLAPLLIILIVGIVDFGNLLNNTQALEAATRIGAEYARGGSSCQQADGWSGVSAMPGPCTTAIQNAVTSSMAFVPALNTPSVSLVCECEQPGTPYTYPATDCGTLCSTNPPPGCASCTGPNRVFITVRATQPFSAMLSWLGMPNPLVAVTTIRVQ